MYSVDKKVREIYEQRINAKAAWDCRQILLVGTKLEM